jgi:hypothetical protein
MPICPTPKGSVSVATITSTNFVSPMRAPVRIALEPVYRVADGAVGRPDPGQGRAHIGLHFLHKFAREVLQVQPIAGFRRDDEPEVMSVTDHLTTQGGKLLAGEIFLRVEDHPSRAIFRSAAAT